MNKTMKRILGAALTLFLGAAIVTVALPEGARAASSHSNHRLCNETICPHDGEHTSITSWTAWNSSTSLPNSAGNYYLTKNVTLANPITLSKDMVLCLNGNTITYTGTGSSAKDADYGIHVRAANVRICNCHEEGGFTMPSDIVNDPVESLIYVQANATDAKGSQLDLFNVNIKNLKSDAIHLGTGTASHMNIYGGEISGCTVFRGAMFLSGNGPAQVHLYDDFKIANNTASEYAYNNAAGVLLSGSTYLYMHDNTAVTGNYTNAIGGIGGIAVHGQGSLYMYDNASVTNNRGHINGVGGIDVPAYYNYLYVKDNVKVTGNTVGSTKANNVNLTSYNTPIRLYNKLTSGASIGVTMETPDVFTTNWTSRMGADAVPTDYFFSDSSAYEVIKSGNEAALTTHTHTYTYTASGAKITESCACGQTGSVTIVKPANNTAAATLTKTGTLSATPTIYYGGYAGTDYPLSTTVPTAAGEYYAQITMGDKTVHVDFTRTHSHAVCSDSTCACGESHASVIWKPWESSTTLPTSRDASNTNSETNTYYYLTQDVVLTAPWVNNLGIDLCLNGHTITYALTTNERNGNAYDGGLNILAASGSYFDDVVLTNCQDLGGITMASSITPCTESLVFVDSKPSAGGSSSTIIADFYNIKISGSKCNALRVGNSTNDYIQLDLHDTQICDNTSVDSAAVEVYTNDTSNYGLTLKGDSAIKNNTATGTAKAGGMHMTGRSNVYLRGNSQISGNSGGIAGGVYVNTSSSSSSYLRLYDNASVKNNSGSTVGGIYVASSGYLYLIDNACVQNNSGTTAGGVYVANRIYAYNAAQVTNNTVGTAANNVYLVNNAKVYMMSSANLADSCSLGITMKNPGVFTNGWTTAMGDADYNQYFSSDDSDYTISKDGNELTLLAVPKVAEVTTWPTASNLVYGDKLSTSTLTGGEASVEGTFSWTDGTVTPTAGTKEYDVTFIPNDSAYAPVTGKVSVTVAKADPYVVWPTAYNINYNTLLKDAVLNGGEASVEGSFAWKNSNTLPPAGTASYPMVFTPADTDNYNTVEGQVSIKVHKLPSTVLTNPTASDITYGDSLAESILSGGIGNYAGDFAWEDPTIKPEVGTHTYTVIFTPENPSYEPSVTTITITVKPATPTVTTWPTASGITYGDKLSDSTLSGGEASVAGTFAWTDATIAPNAGTATYSVTFAPDSANYTPVTGQVTVEVAKATPYFTSPFPYPFSKLFASELTYGQTLGESSISVNTLLFKLIPESCTISWDAPDTVPAVGTTSYPVTIYPNNENYTTLSMDVSVKVTQATPVVTTWPTASDIVEGSTFADSVLTGGEASVPGTFSWKNPSDTPALGTNEYEVVFTPDDTTNYEPVMGSVTITVTHDFTEKIVDAAHFVAGSGADCQDAKLYYFDCSKCNTMSTTLTFEEGVGAHVPAETATSNGDGTHSVRCTVDGCNHAISTQDCDGPAATCTTASVCDTCGYTIEGSLGHDMNTAWTSQGASGHIRYCARNCGHSETDVHHMPGLWTYVDGTTHTRSCEDNCGYSETANHAGGEASCSSKATCTDCQRAYGNPLPHDWKDDFQHDEEGHWHDCENCNATSTVEPHNPGPEATEDAPQICTTCQRVLVPTLAHVHNNPTYVEEEPATCTKDGKMAHYECRCGLLFMDEACTQQADDLVIPALQHDMPDTWTMLDEDYHTRACSRNCGHSETAPHAMGDWTYLNETEHQRSCTEAGCTYTETEDHKGGEATCSDPAQCSTCGESYGEALEHDMPDAWTFLNEEVHQRVCEHGCGHSETDEHHMSAWTYVDENTHQRVCTDETLTREVITACGWVQTAEHSDEDGDGNCDGCAQPMPGSGDGGDGGDGNEGEGGGNTEGDKDDTPNTGDRHMFLLIAAAALFLIGALGAGFKYVYAKRNRFF